MRPRARTTGMTALILFLAAALAARGCGSPEPGPQRPPGTKSSGGPGETSGADPAAAPANEEERAKARLEEKLRLAREEAAQPGWIRSARLGDEALGKGDVKKAHAIYEGAWREAHEASALKDPAMCPALGRLNYNFARVLAATSRGVVGSGRDAEVLPAAEADRRRHQAFDCLGNAFLLGFDDFADARANPDFESLRSDPAFELLVSNYERKRIPR